MHPLLTLLLLSSGATAAWELDQSIEELASPFDCPAEILGGSFQLDAEFTLQRLDGTAASVKFGEQLNFGFDSRKATLFVEGRSVGEPRLLNPTRNFLEAGKPFVFNATREDSGTLVISINGRTAYRTNKVRGPLGTITIRPHRNTIDIHALRLRGSVKVPEPGLTLRRPVIPILADGEDHPLLDLDLVLEKPRTLSSVGIDLSGSCDPGDLRSLSLQKVGGEPIAGADRCDQSLVLKGSLGLPAGRHRFQLLGSVHPGADPGHELVADCRWLGFADKERISPHPHELPPLRTAYPIHKRGQFDCHTFRIPAIARAKDGSLLAVYDMRHNSRRDLQEHIDIGLSRSTDGGRSWADPVPIMDMGQYGGKPEKENGCSDPGILVDTETGEIFVSAVWTHGKPNTHQWRGTGSEPGHDIHRSSQLMVVRSNDHGRTWSKPENWTKDLKDPAWHLFAPAPGNGITLRDGTLVMPTQGRDANGTPFSNITWSRDHGETWNVSNHARSDTTECAVAELSGGSLLLNMRDNRNRADKSETNGRALAVTRDLGATWTTHPADHGALPEPVCMASMISHTLADGRHVLLFSNPRNKESRREMTIQISFDNGETWPPEHRLLLDQTGGAYSSLVMVDDQNIGILYESSQADLVFQKIPLSDLVK